MEDTFGMAWGGMVLGILMYTWFLVVDFLFSFSFPSLSLSLFCLHQVCTDYV